MTRLKVRSSHWERPGHEAQGNLEINLLSLFPPFTVNCCQILIASGKLADGSTKLMAPQGHLADLVSGHDTGQYSAVGNVALLVMSTSPSSNGHHLVWGAGLESMNLVDIDTGIIQYSSTVTAQLICGTKFVPKSPEGLSYRTFTPSIYHTRNYSQYDTVLYFSCCIL